MASWHAASAGARVVLFEKQKMIGRKIRATGNGRCNITNRNIDVSFYHGRNPQFVRNVFGRFGLEETVAFFRDAGIPFVELESGRLYPASLQATSVTRIFEYELERLGVEVRLHRKIERIDPLTEPPPDHGRPGTGGLRRGDPRRRRLRLSATRRVAFRLRARLHAGAHGARSVPFDPSRNHHAQGAPPAGGDKARLLGVGLALRTPRRPQHRRTAFYEVRHIGGLEVSRSINESQIGRGPGHRHRFLPDTGAPEIDSLLSELWSDAERPVSLSLRGVLRDRLCETLIRICGIDPAVPVKSLSARQKAEIAGVLKGLRLRPGAPRPFGEAVVAAGGVDVGEVNPVSLESKLVRGLHITGELLDIDGDSGGYNLQFAWSTGALAGAAAAS